MSDHLDYLNVVGLVLDLGGHVLVLGHIEYSELWAVPRRNVPRGPHRLTIAWPPLTMGYACLNKGP